MAKRTMTQDFQAILDVDAKLVQLAEELRDLSFLDAARKVEEARMKLASRMEPLQDKIYLIARRRG